MLTKYQSTNFILYKDILDEKLFHKTKKGFYHIMRIIFETLFTSIKYSNKFSNRNYVLSVVWNKLISLYIFTLYDYKLALIILIDVKTLVAYETKKLIT